jgi:hypothetical protein
MTPRLRLGVAVAFAVFGAIAAIVTVVGSAPGERATIALMVPAFIVPALVGGLILVRRPENPIGWLFCLVGFGLAATMAVATAVTAALTEEPIPSWAVLAGWAGQGLFLLFVVPAVLVILTFPTGRLPSRRWRPVVIALIASAVASGIGAAFGRATLDGTDPVRLVNPFVAPEPLRSILDAGRSIGDVASLVVLLPAAAAIVIRMRRAQGVERLQLEWFAYAVAMLAILLPLSALIPSASGLQWGLAVLGFGAALPLAAGIAIMRYRLYDIDVVIRRTLVYGAVVAILGAVYAGLVLALQTALQGFTGGGTLPVAVSTLVIAALFGPVRSRVRAVVDRRFFRSRYDARRTLEAFSTRLRDEVELEAVGHALSAASGHAVHPATVGVWLRRSAP